MMMTKTEVAEFLRVSTKTVERGVKAGRHINYLWQYEDMVRATVAEMVKPEALKEKE